VKNLGFDILVNLRASVKGSTAGCIKGVWKAPLKIKFKETSMKSSTKIMFKGIV